MDGHRIRVWGLALPWALAALFSLSWPSSLPGGAVKDLAVSSPYGSRAGNLTVVGSDLFFTAEDPAYGVELWKSDGTAAGTGLVMDINPGAMPAQTGTGFVGGEGYSSTPSSLTEVDGMLYFLAARPDGSYGLWRTERTGANTQLVKDLTGLGTASCLTAAGGRLYFRMSVYPSTSEVWTSGGSAVSTVRLKDTTGAGFYRFSPMGSSLYFLKSGTQLWRTSGTAGTTVLVKDFGSGWVNPNDTPLQSAGGFLIFRVQTGTQTQAWRSDGTAAGTIPLATVTTDFVDESFTAAGTQMFFLSRVSFPATSFTLWRSDGTAAGTSSVRTLETLSSTAPKLAAQGSAVLFGGYSSSTGTELWRSDGTPGGTALLKELNPGGGSSNPANFTGAGSWVYFLANRSGTAYELWRSDGSADGTSLVKASIEFGEAGIDVTPVGDASGRLFFVANDPARGRELWKSDGTEAGTAVIKDINGGSSTGAAFGSAVGMGSSVYFAYDDGAHGSELWKSDGTPGGTVLVKDIVDGTGSSSPKHLRVLNGRLLFFANSELWRTDGTEAGTVHVCDVDGPDPGTAAAMAEMGSTLYFSGYHWPEGRELWRTDGTTAGTVMVKDIAAVSPTDSSSPDHFAVWEGSLYFSAASDSTAGAELWKSDGTAAGTALVVDLYSNGSSSPALLTAIPGGVCFVARDPVYGMRQLFRTDGSAGGTQVVKRVANSYDDTLQDLRASGSQACFVVVRPYSQWELWKTDGTEAGTLALHAFPYSGSPVSIHGSSNALPMAEAGGRLFFVGNEEAIGMELWNTDLTPAGTQLVSDIWPGGPSSCPLGLVAGAGGKVYFSAADPTHGYELWQSDGTADGTEIVEDLLPGMESSQPVSFTAAGNRLFYLAVAPNVTGWQLRAQTSPWRLIVSSSSGGGSVSGGGSYLDGALAPISANPAPGYVFTGWTGAGIANATEAKTAVAMTADRAAVASFAAVPAVGVWAADHGLAGGDADPLARPAGDGVPNLVKYAFNLSPLVPEARVLSPGSGTAGLPAIFRSDGGGSGAVLHVEFLRRRGALLTYTPQISTDLSPASWTPIDTPPSLSRIDYFWERAVYDVPLGGLPGQSCFSRVQVTSPGP